MAEITIPMQVPELRLNPPIEGTVKLSTLMQQVLSLLCCYDGNKRVLIKATSTGVLNTCSARIQDIIHVTGSGADDDWQGSDLPCSEVMVMGHPDNGGLIWVRSDKAALATNAWPVAANAVFNCTVDNLKQLHALIKVDGEKLIVAYTR